MTFFGWMTEEEKRSQFAREEEGEKMHEEEEIRRRMKLVCKGNLLQGEYGEKCNQGNE